MTDYKKTLCLPRTTFPMKANLKQKEPETLDKWEKVGAYELMVAAGQGRPRWVLHDGPPYANGHIHMGTAMNKVLKDMIVKSRNLLGYKAEYVPGWDCHGLPIEHKVAQDLRAKNKVLPPLTVRKICREYASKWLDVQRKEFKRLGCFGTWEEPYQTMDPSYEAATARELGNFIKNGSVYRGKKPIYWCLDCQTALAEAEVEYGSHTSPSIFVRFPLTGERLCEKLPAAEEGRTHALIWTTTPWTIPANLAVAAHPDFDYALVKTGGEYYLLAKDLLEQSAPLFGWDDYEVVQEVKGSELAGLVARHPFLDRDSIVVNADYVTLEAGTGLVHTAPGHGREDYETGLRHGLEILSPLDDEGRFTQAVPMLAGKTVWEANPEVIGLLENQGHLLAQARMSHSYPHCWRCKRPVIFRATTQWFISMSENGLRDKALDAIDNQVRWIPSWGKERIHSMIEQRPDWCISRQRTWGVPIVALICKNCDHVWCDPDWVFSVVDAFETHERGCDYWFEAELDDLLPPGLSCPDCDSRDWKKEDDILDVWFDSGTSFAAVVEKRDECHYPADMYLEGTDQHRGWFHSSLLASVGTRGRAPYNSVLTHGYVVDAKGHKMSKSVGNVIAPQEIIDKYGAEILRMWVSAVNFQEDVRISEEILQRLVDAYRRIRNTARFILGNLDDFTPAQAVEPDHMEPLDRWGLELVLRAHERIRTAFEDFEFHKVHHTLHNLCATDLSAFYLDVTKDKLYVEAKNGARRRSAQSVLAQAILLLAQDMFPVLSFTAEEIFSHIPEPIRPGIESVFALRHEPASSWRMDPMEAARFEKLMLLRSEVTRAIEPLRQSGEIGHSLDTRVTVYLPEDYLEALEATGVDLTELCIVSQARTRPGAEAPADALAGREVEGLFLEVQKAAGEKCPRCWNYSEQLGESPDHPDICPRCARVVSEIEAAASHEG